MDVNWFKQQQKRAGVTAEDIARIAGRARSGVSNIYAGNSSMTMDWAQAFAQALDVPLDEVLRRAGQIDPDQSVTPAPGFSEGDAAPFDHMRPKTQTKAEALGADRPGVDVWQVRTQALALNGFLPGDYFLLDTHRSETARAGDFVVAQHYDWQGGSAVTLLRRYEPPVLVAASMQAEDRRALVVDGRNIVIKGVITASWRELTA